MAKDFVISIPEDKIGQWLPFNVPSSSTGFPCFEVGQLGGSIKCSYSPDGKNAKPLLLNGIVPEGVTLYCMANTPASAILNDFFFRNKIIVLGSGGGGGGVGGGTTYSFSSPLQLTGSDVSISLSSDFKLSSNSLALDLQNNQDFTDLVGLVNSIANSDEQIGQISSTNADVTSNTQLLTTYVQQEKQRTPRNGDVVYTSDNPSYKWIFTDIGWVNLGVSGIGIATNSTLGLVKGSNTITIGSDGSASVEGVVLTSGNQNVDGEKTFNNTLRLNAILNLRSNSACINFEGMTGFDQGYGIRFQGDTLTANSSVDMLRFHKAGNKWNIKAYLNSSNAFDRVEINGPTKITNMLTPTASTHGANKQYVDDASTTTLQDAKDYFDTKLISIPATETPSPSTIPEGSFGIQLRG